MTKQKKIFAIIAVIFIVIVLIVTVDMMSKTTAPWNKKKELLKKYDTDFK